MRSLACSLVVGVLSVVSSGCGLRTPDLQFPAGTTDDARITVNHIVNEVKCELIQGVVKALNYDKAQTRLNPGRGRKLEWLEKWSAKVTLMLSVEEITAFNPGLSFTQNFPVDVQHFANGTSLSVQREFNLGLGGAFSADANRIEKLDFFFAFADFLTKPDPNTNLEVPCQHQSDVLIESDLKLGEWIEIATFPGFTESIKTPAGFTLPMDVISHEVSFEVKAAGNVTPSWRLVPVSLNTGGLPFFAAQRNNTDDVLVTLGPTADAGAAPTVGAAAAAETISGKAMPSQALTNSHLASEIGAAVAAAIRMNQ